MTTETPYADYIITIAPDTYDDPAYPYMYLISWGEDRNDIRCESTMYESVELAVTCAKEEIDLNFYTHIDEAHELGIPFTEDDQYEATMQQREGAVLV